MQVGELVRVGDERAFAERLDAGQIVLGATGRGRAAGVASPA